MSARVFTIKLAQPGTGPKSIQEALQLAATTGVIELPKEALQLTINAGRQVEVTRGK